MKVSFLIISLSFIVFSKALFAEDEMSFLEIAESLGYPTETHYIETADGYINTFFRIQARSTKIVPGLTPVYLQHGLFNSANTWVVNDEEFAPGFAVANAGYDVWVGNSRGTIYSMNHTKLSVDEDSDFWKFSWQEMSQYDLPAAFKYIANETGKEKIHYIGHSQGTAMMFAALIRQDETILKYLGQYHALGPISRIAHGKSALLKVAMKSHLLSIVKLVSGQKVGHLNSVESAMVSSTCKVTPFVCSSFLKKIFDSNLKSDNLDRLPFIMRNEPGGTSLQNVRYWQQLINDKEFNMYDFGAEGNRMHYKRSTPPPLDLSQIDYPVHLHVGRYDNLGTPEDEVILYNILRENAPESTYHEYDYGHMTFPYASDSICIDKVLSMLNKEENDSSDIDVKFLN